MAIEIKTISEERIRVNNKIVYRDKDGHWVSVSELTTREKEAFDNYLQAYETYVTK